MYVFMYPFVMDYKKIIFIFNNLEFILEIFKNKVEVALLSLLIFKKKKVIKNDYLEKATQTSKTKSSNFF
jgi:hypothetical protein